MRAAVAALVVFALVASQALEIDSSVRVHAVPKRGKGVSVRDSVLPGMQGALSQNALNYVLNTALPAIFAAVQGASLPEIDGESKVPILGKVKYTISNIKINQLSYANAGISVQNDITASVTGVEVKIKADWHYKQKSWPHISSGGSVDITIKDSGLSISVRTGVTSSGDPQLYVDSVSCDFEKLDISVHGSILSWLYDLIFDIAKNTIKNDAAKAVQDALTSLINTMADKALASIPLVIPTSKTTQLDFSLTSAPSLPNSNIVAAFKGQFENVTNAQACPVPHIAFPSTLPTQHLLLQLDQFIFNSGLWLVYQNGKLDVTVSQKNIPPSVPFSLNTSTFAAILPELFKAYPNAGIEWHLSAVSQPTANFTGDGLAASAVFAMEWLAQDSTGQFQSAFTAELNLGVLVHLELNSTAISGNMSLTGFNLQLLSSHIGPVDLTLLQTFMGAILEGPIMTLINDAIAQGFPLPVIEGFSFVNPKIVYHEQYAELNTDLKISVPAAVRAELHRAAAAHRAAAQSHSHRHTAAVRLH